MTVKVNLSILFEASGCAINVRMKLTVGLGRLFTFIPPYHASSDKRKLNIVAQLAKNIKKTKGSDWIRLIKVALLTIIICLLIYLSFILFI